MDTKLLFWSGKVNSTEQGKGVFGAKVRTQHLT